MRRKKTSRAGLAPSRSSRPVDRSVSALDTGPSAADDDVGPRRHREVIMKPTFAVVVLLAAAAAAPAQGTEKKEGGRFLTAAVKRGEVEDVARVSAQLEARDVAEVAAAVDGVVEKVHVAEGDRVKKGQPLATLNDAPLRLKLDAAKAALRKAQAELLQQEARVAQAQAEVKRAAAEARDAAVAALEAARAGTEVAKAVVEGAQVEVKRAEMLLEQATVRSPIDGVVSRAYFAQGRMVHGGGEPLFRVLDTTTLQVRAPLSEAEGLRLRQAKGKTEGRLILPTGAAEGVAARLDRVAVELEPGREGTPTLPATFLVDNKDGRLLPGASASLTVSLGRRANALVLPLEAVRWQPTADQIAADGRVVGPGVGPGRGGGRQIGPDGRPIRMGGGPGAGADRTAGTVIWVEDKGLARSVRVVLGARSGSVVEVVDGLKEGDVVIVGTAPEPKPGDR
jgi:RND family efflux transporter MFP subunit